MADPAKSKWWNDVVSVDSVKLNDYVYLLWGDRVRILEEDQDGRRVKVAGRGSTGWIDKDALGGEELLEFYFIDVGQGDGILIVTPEGHHLMIDGGLQRSRQQTGKNAADFVDWKFYKDYLNSEERQDPTKKIIRLDAVVSSHADSDHYGGLRDLIDREIEVKAGELNCTGVTVETFYQPGLCPQESGTEKLGLKSNGYFVELLGDRASAEEGLQENPQNSPKLRGEWRDFIAAVLQQKKADGSPTPIVRLSQKSGFLPGFSENDDSSVTIRVLAPIEKEVDGIPALRDLGDEGENKNGHSIALRVNYRDRSILLTGDLNEKSQADILQHYGATFPAKWGVDVVKACHHGSHHVDFGFLDGVGALATIFSSGDANTYDHPRSWVLGAAAIAGRIIKDPEKPRLKAPLIYSTEVARSVALKSIDQLREYEDVQEYGQEKGQPIQTISGEVTKKKWRVILDRKSKDSHDLRPVAQTKVMRDIVYGLVNVRTDGRRLLFAVRNEGNASWSYETMEPAEIASAFRLRPDAP